MNIKRRAGIITAALVLGLSPLAAVQAAGPYNITLAGGSVGGAWSAIGTAIGETIKTDYPGSAFTYEPGRETGNLLLTSTGKVQLGIAHAQMALIAEKGLEPFKQPLSNIRAIAMIDPEAAVQILATESSGITNLADIKAKKMPVRVSLNQRGTLMAITGEAILAAYGVTVKDIESWGGRVSYGAYNAGLDLMKNGQADLIINMLAFPSSQVANAARDTKFRMIGLSKEAITKLNTDLGTQTITVPAKSYAFQPEAINTIRGSVIIVASTSMSNQEAGDIVRAMLKNFDFLQKAHATLSRLTPNALTQTAPIALHPGAAAAYKAAGLIK
jgi:TRAP transporter TAXI family solute receptor